MNINDKVSVTLTAHGAKMMNFYSDQFIARPTPIVVKGSIYETELWQLMSIFGRYIYPDMTPKFFVDNEITIIEAK